jgi:hypothetical protein
MHIIDAAHGKPHCFGRRICSTSQSRHPSFFRGHCQLACVHDALYFFGHPSTPTRLALAEAAVEAAFRPRLARVACLPIPPRRREEASSYEIKSKAEAVPNGRHFHVLSCQWKQIRVGCRCVSAVDRDGRAFWIAKVDHRDGSVCCTHR